MAIKNLNDYKRISVLESEYFKGAYNSNKEKFILNFTKDLDFYYIRTFLITLRKCELYRNTYNKFYFLKNLHYYFLKRKKNKLASRLGFSIAENVLGEGVVICHPNVVINPKSKIGNGCVFHGNNCIGNKGFVDDKGTPILGNNVEIGFGAVVIGGITIADGIKIGANSVVTKSFLEPNIIIAGNPAKQIK